MHIYAESPRYYALRIPPFRSVSHTVAPPRVIPVRKWRKIKRETPAAPSLPGWDFRRRPRWTVKVPFAKSPKPTYSLSHTVGSRVRVLLHDADNEKGGPLLLRNFNYNKLRMELSHGVRRFVFTLVTYVVTHGANVRLTRWWLILELAGAACSKNVLIWWNYTLCNKQTTPAALI